MMSWWKMSGSLLLRVTGLVVTGGMLAGVAGGQAPSNDPPRYGPYNAVFLQGGLGLRVALLNKTDTVLRADAPWTLSCWYNSANPVQGLELLAGIGEVTGEFPRYLAIEPGKVVLWDGQGNQLAGAARNEPGTWHLVSATFDGSRFRLFSDGQQVAEGSLILGSAAPVLQLAPERLVAAQAAHFGGRIASFQLLREALSEAEMHRMAATPPNFALPVYEEGSKPWPIQTREWAGYTAPQDPAQMPVGRAPFGAPVAQRRPPVGESLVAAGGNVWTFGDGWTLREEPRVSAPAGQVASASFAGADWMRATVPGTVLTTMIDDGIYPDPYYGLNNLAIPETLNKQRYWYRNVFRMPAAMRSALGSTGRLQMTFEGINYQADVWLNGQRLGMIKGAFNRGQFDVTDAVKADGENVLAVLIAPPPHPGIPQEQSVLGGAGENGGTMELDGPTFLATEGWDWIPAIRDRNSGLWQPVTLSVTQGVRLGDTQVVSRFPDHTYTHAELEVKVPVENSSGHAVEGSVELTLEGVRVRKAIHLPPGATQAVLEAKEFPQLRLDHPRLWWPNGYGKPELYTAELSVTVDGKVSDTKKVRFGVRELSYELSLLDESAGELAGTLRRVEFTPSLNPFPQVTIVDVSHAGMRQIPSADAGALGIPEERRDEYTFHTFVSSLAPGAAGSPAVRAIPDGGPAPYLVLRVNGVRIAARGGNWGMDDARKRVSRERLEPYFRLDRDANMNIIRNWVGQNTEETFYELADEYGMMVWNDFWESTQNYNTEAQDPALFLANAKDTIEHFRNHPSIVLWCGRNEGVPQPIINEGLDELVRTLDGTRFYSPSSNQVNLQQSGPYSYQDPSLYYTALNRGFSVETGTPSMSTLESFESTIPKADQWPIGDAWAYHDWHQAGNGRVQPFMAEIEAEFGAATSLPDFERKAQMLNYVDHRAIFEGMNANLWSPNSGRLLWMTQPAWPSTMWQILSSDYDTQASFYGAQKGAEPVHVQLNLANDQVDAVNTTTATRPNVTVSARVYSLGNQLLLENRQTLNLAADERVHAFTLPLRPLLDHGMVLVRLMMTEADGTELSRNLYWLGASSPQYRALASLPVVGLKIDAVAKRAGDEVVLTAKVSNPAAAAVLAAKLTLLDSAGKRILPAYYSDNYVSLLPGETETVTIRFPFSMGSSKATLAVRGWNVEAQRTEVALPR